MTTPPFVTSAGVYFTEVGASTTSAFPQVMMQSVGVQLNASDSFSIQVQSTAGFDTLYNYQQNNYFGKDLLAFTASDTLDLGFLSGSAGQTYTSIGQKWLAITPLRVGP